MKRFIFTLVALFLLYLVIGFSVLFVRLVLWQRDVDALYTISPDQTWLCVGASHVGASLPQIREFHNKLLWLHSTHPADTLMRLLELERRGQLGPIKLVVTQFGPLYAKESECWYLPSRAAENWMRELPVNWRYLWTCPVSGSVLFLTLVKNLYHVNLEISNELSNERKAWFDRTEEFRTERLSTYVHMHFDNYENSVDITEEYMSQYERIAEFCSQRGMRFCLFASPLLSDYRAQMPPLLKSRADDAIRRLRRSGIRVYDCRAAYVDELFADPLHLASSGARQFIRDFQKWEERTAKGKCHGESDAKNALYP